MIHAAKTTAKRFLRCLSQRWIGQTRLCADLQRLGVLEGGIALVHSSLSSLGFVRGGPIAVIAALDEVLGAKGTIVLPTHTWLWMNQGCREFDVRHTRSCVGSITEVFRELPDVVRSLHPTHSVAARGPLAEELTRNHEFADTPCGSGTPYARVLDRNGQIILLGVGLESNTAFHTLEALGGVEYLMQDAAETFTILDSAGHRRQLEFRRHRNGIARRFAEMEPLLSQGGVVRAGMVGCAKSMILDGKVFRDRMLLLLNRDKQLLLE